MEENLIYTVGETLLLELDGVVDITYPPDETPQKLTMITENGSYEQSELRENEEKEYVIKIV